MKLTDDELVSAIEAEEETAINWADGPLADLRAEAWNRYNCEPYGNEVDGRSQVVSSTIRDQVEGVMPSLARIFLSGEEIGRFEPIDPSDEGFEIESAAVNWMINTKNDGFSTCYVILKEALMLGNSYAKVWWQTRDDIASERYTGLSDEEASLLLQDKDVQVVEHTEYPDPYSSIQREMSMMMEVQPPPGMLHDIKVERVKPDEYVAVCAVPPNELLVNSTHREVSLANADFVQHRREMSIGELRELGYKIDENIGDDVDDDDRPEALARDRFNAYNNDDEDNAFDPSRRRVTLRETWIRLGDGKARTLYRVCIVGREILHQEEADLVPIASFSPILYPHSHAGVSFYALVEDIAELETTITRQYLDNLYLANNARTVVDVGRVNIDDLLVSRPGGIVRVDGEPGTALMPLVTPDVGQAALQALEMLKATTENRTGYARVNQGATDPNTLNRTATGASLMMSAGQARLELIARCLAGGFKDLFLLVHAIMQKHSTKPMQLRLKNKWIATNPREWARRTDFSLSVALGTGAPEQQLAKLQMVGQFMAQGQAIGIVTRDNMYNWAVEFLKTAGYKSPDKFVTQPDPQQPPPQQTPPEVQAAQIQAQGLAQVEQIKQQGQTQNKQLEIQSKASADAQKAQQDAQLTLTIERYKTDQQMELERFKAQLQADTAIMIKRIEMEARAQIEAMKPEPQPSFGAQ